MRAEIITVGDELLIGQTINTNASWIGESLGLVGIDVRRVLVVGDDEVDMSDAIKLALQRAQLVVITGGLGPTHDDVTREVVSAYFKTTLVFDQRLFGIVKERFERRGRSVPESNRTQAMVPLGFEVLPNPIGTSPGFWKRVGTADRPVYVAVVPGVPREMKRMVLEQVIPRFLATASLPVIRHQVIQTSGIGESHLQDKLEGVTSQLGDFVTLAYLPSLEGLKLRLTVRARDAAFAESELNRVRQFIVDRAGHDVYSISGESLEVAIGRLLTSSGESVAVAESCTGGRVLDRLTNVPGSSSYVKGGVVAYGNDVKVNSLGVSEELLRVDGAVSEAVALEMAKNVRLSNRADIGLSLTGIMGPGGGTAEKPVGTVWIGLSRDGRDIAELLKLGTDRESNKRRAVVAVLNLLRQDLAERGFSEL